jgi:hypothetical protein
VIIVAIRTSPQEELGWYSLRVVCDTRVGKPSGCRLIVGSFLGPTLYVTQKLPDVNATMDRRIAREFFASLAELARHPSQIAALVVIQTCRDLDQGLQKTPVDVSDLMPKILPRLMSLEVILSVEVPDAGFEPSVPTPKSIHD